MCFVSKNPREPLKTTNCHFHILVCGASLSTLTGLVRDYFLKIIGSLIVRNRFDQNMNLPANINLGKIRYYKLPNSTKQVIKSALSNLNVHVATGSHTKKIIHASGIT